MREDVFEFSGLLASVYAPTQQELKIAEYVAAFNAGGMSKIARIDESDEERRKRKAYHHNVRKYHTGAFKAASSRETTLIVLN